MTSFSASQLARLIRAGELSARQVVQAFVSRIEQVNPRLNAMVLPLFEQALDDARIADELQARGGTLGPLHGVPVSIKECFQLAGTAATLGNPGRSRQVADQDGILVRRLRQAGAIVLGKTNVPQLMLSHECDNPLYGRTNNPWDPRRTPGGSSGGEAALLAAGGSPLGLGSDLGGSLRVPAHFCGIQALKPTSGRLPRTGVAHVLAGMEAVQFQPGPLARSVDDLELALRVLHGSPSDRPGWDAAPGELFAAPPVPVESLRFAVWCDAEPVPVSPAIHRVVRQAADALESRGARRVELRLPASDWVGLFLSILGADGGASSRRLLRGEPIAWPLRRLLLVSSLPGWLRPLVSGGLRAWGQPLLADLVSLVRRRSADEYWQLTARQTQAVEQFERTLEQAGVHVLLCPAYATPAPWHGSAHELLPAARYSYLPNLLGVPCGLVAAGRVQVSEQWDRPRQRDWVLREARRVDADSAGLPVGVQVVSRCWREDLVLAVMRLLEAEFSRADDYPRLAPL